mmetsp:Transcript_14203/g.20289  ORF Transcript_14203/g.20289 Transcript_14203/m.20289 type:complete len:243 (+) Transcript_14203:69-797(+)
MTYKKLAFSFIFLQYLCLVKAWVSTHIGNRKIRSPQQSGLHMAGPGGGRQSKKNQQEMIEFMNEPMEESVDISRTSPGPPGDDDLAPLVRTIARAADMRKAEGIIALRVSKVSSVTGFVLVVSGNSRPQNQAIASAIIDEVKEDFGEEFEIRGNGVPEGNADSGWILLDYGDVMVHIMTPKSRLFYDIEGQWKEKGGEYMDLNEILLPNIPQTTETTINTDGSAQVGGGMGGLSEEEDPFWS